MNFDGLGYLVIRRARSEAVEVSNHHEASPATVEAVDAEDVPINCSQVQEQDFQRVQDAEAAATVCSAEQGTQYEAYTKRESVISGGGLFGALMRSAPAVYAVRIYKEPQVVVPRQISTSTDVRETADVTPGWRSIQ